MVVVVVVGADSRAARGVAPKTRNGPDVDDVGEKGQSRVTLIVAFDPAKSTGFAIVEDGEIVLSGQCEFEDAMGRVFVALGRRVPDAVAIEYPSIPRGSSEGRAASALSVGWKAGCLFGRCVTLWPTATMWQPRPPEWRKYIGIKGKDRKALTANAMRWASATLGMTLAKSDDDRAMAIGIGFACQDHLRELAAAATTAAVMRANIRRPA